MHLEPDSLLQGRYRIGELIAQGGMGAVYRATDERLGHTVAIKQTLLRDAALRAAFEREARLLAALSHPALPVVSDHFVEQDGQFLVMQFIPGPDLAGLLKRRAAPFTPDEVAPWALSLLDALEYLHGHQPPIIHRDIKPQNLKPAAHGGVILLDFGLAKGQTDNIAATTSASLFGYTPQFAPIEQIQGSGTDARSDLYALAATLYNLLTGRPPVDALTRVSAVVKGETDPLPPADALNPALSPLLVKALSRSLSINPALRPGSAAELRRELEAAFAQQPVTDTTQSVAKPNVLPSPPAAALPPPPAPLTTRQAFLPIAIVGMVLVTLCIGAGFLLMASLFTRSESGVATTSVETLLALTATIPTEAPTLDHPPVSATLPAATLSEDAPGYRRDNPLPMGTPLAFHGWRVEVVAMIRGEEAYERLRRANSNNGPPREGMEYLLLSYRITSTAHEAQRVPSGELRVLGSRGEAYAQSSLVAPPPRLSTLDEVAPGATVEGWAAYMLGQEEEQLLLVLGEDTILAAARFVALTPNASLSLLTDRSGLRPDQQGQDWRTPVAVGQVVITDDWEIRLNEVLRGAAAWERISASSSRAEPAPAGYEYVLAHVSMRYISTEERARLSYESYFIATVGNSASERISVASPEPRLRALLFPGGSAEGWIALTIVADEPDARIVFKNSSLGFQPDGFNTRYFALE